MIDAKTNLDLSIEQIEEANELKVIEKNNNLRLRFKAEIWKRIIYLWLPIVGLCIVFIIWLITKIPDYQGCVRDCQRQVKQMTMQSKDDCQFYCNIKFGN